MSRLTFALAAGLLASTAAAQSSIAMYWGQGSNQIPLSEVCADPTIDIVNIGFVNGFPKKIGDYPKTNFANACWGYYPDPNSATGADSGLLLNCPGVGEAIQSCQAAGKKVLLSLGGGWPNDYYLPSKDVAEWFAGFLLDTFGPMPSLDYDGPRPFDGAAVDGFDFDLEANADEVPSPEFLYANYDHLINKLKTLKPKTLISAAPQCQVPDIRLGPVIKNAPFDYIFTQFYNTDECSARRGFAEIKQATTGFTFNKWADWLVANSANKNVKLYLGLAAGEDGLPTHKEDYLKPEDAADLIAKWSKAYPNIFGGVMLWEATVSKLNQVKGQSYGYWMKAVVEGKFKQLYNPTVSSSTRASSTRVSSTRLSSSTRASSTRVSSSTRASSTRISSSTRVSSSSIRSSSVVRSSSTVRSSSAYPTSSVHVTSSYPASSASSSYPASSASSSYPASSASSSYPASSPSAASSSYPASSPSAASSYPASSPSPASSSGYPASSASSSEYPASSGYPASEPSSVYPDSTPEPSKGYPHSTPEPASSTPCTTSSTEKYPESTPKAATSTDKYPESTPEAASSTPCTTSSVEYPAKSSSAPVYPAKSSSAPVYPADETSVPSYPESTPEAASSSPCSTSAYPAKSSSADYPVYGEETPKGGKSSYPEETPKGGKDSYGSYPEETPKGHDSYPTVTKKPEYSDSYPSKPTDTTTVVTTTYVDVCETGLKTYTTTYTKTVCGSCAKPTNEPEYPSDWTTSVYVSKTVTVTITKPIHPASDVPAYPTGAPSKPEEEKPVYGADYPSQPQQEYPAQPSKAEYPPVYQTLSKAYTPAPYPTAGHGKPAYNASSAYVPKPTGTGSYPTKPTSYSPAAPEFTGAASRASFGFAAVVGVVAFFAL